MKRRALDGFYTLTLAMAGDAPPAEFRIFAAGANPTRKGPALFDAEAARLLMADYEAHGTDIMIDLEHLSLDDDAPNFDPDARGWLKLELRNGELWAVDVRWTPDGEARLKSKRQRYISPAFVRDKKSSRAIQLHNVAITATPATDHLTPLVAATAKGTAPMRINPKLLAALGLAEGASEEDVANAMAEAMKDPAKRAAVLGALADTAAALPAPAEGEAMADKGKEATALKVPQSNALADALAAEVVSLKSRVEASEVRDLISANRSKLGTPALERWALSQTPKALADFLAAAPTAPTAKEQKEPKKETETVSLTAEERKLCRLTNRSEADLLKHKTELAARVAEEG